MLIKFAEYKMNCPHCNRKITRENVPDIDKAERNAENYGESNFYFQCPHKKCGKKFSIWFEVHVNALPPEKVLDDTDLSYG